MTMTTVMTSGGRELRWLADSYEQAQRVRIETGERIRAVLQGRDETWTTEEDWVLPDGWITLEEMAILLENAETKKDKKAIKKQVKKQVKDILKEIAAGEHIGPVMLLGRTYHRHHFEERELKGDMKRSLHAHPCWPWLEEVRGMGPTLSCKILARLDPEKAPHASSFWSYCGLATVPGERYRCATCGLDRTWPVGYNVTGKHQALSSSKNCPGALVKISGPEDGVRCAQPRASKGEKASYDAYAKKIMYLIGTAFLKAGGPYERHYRSKRAMLELERPGWADGRKHLTAMRAAEKLFLSHLWQVWREALGLPVGEPYAHGILGHDVQTRIKPWDMVGK